jgi:hypothetical protein
VFCSTESRLQPGYWFLAPVFYLTRRGLRADLEALRRARSSGRVRQAEIAAGLAALALQLGLHAFEFTHVRSSFVPVAEQLGRELSGSSFESCDRCAAGQQ